MSKSKKKSNQAFRKNLLILFLIFIILGAGYLYVRHYENDPSAPVVSSENIPDYIPLENNDSLKYIAVVLYNHNVNINTIARTFYGDNAFWPYIFLANENEPAIKTNPLDIPKNTIVKLPRIQGLKNKDGNLNPEAIEEARALADTLLRRLPSFN